MTWLVLSYVMCIFNCIFSLFLFLIVYLFYYMNLYVIIVITIIRFVDCGIFTVSFNVCHCLCFLNLRQGSRGEISLFWK